MPRLRVISYPSKIASKYIKTHWDFEDDLKDILERSGSREDISGKYRQRLKYLEESKEQCILMTYMPLNLIDHKRTLEFFFPLSVQVNKNLQFCSMLSKRKKLKS